MQWFWYAAAFLSGLALGLLFIGYVLKVAFHHWEGGKSAINLAIAAVSFLFGTGGGAAIFTYLPDNSLASYFIGLALGIIWGVRHAPALPSRYTMETVLRVVCLSERLRPTIPDNERRAAVILAMLSPPTSSRLSSEELAAALGEGLDDISED